MVSDDKRCLFVHVQKTGGVTVQETLEELLPDARPKKRVARHDTLAQILEREPELRKYWTFGFVRNPWARMVSWFEMVPRFKAYADEGIERYAKQFRENKFLISMHEDYSDFDAFIMKAPEQWARLRTPQISYLVTSTRHADFIGRTESLEADMRAVFARLDLPAADLPQLNAGKPSIDYRDYYTDTTRARVAEMFARDVAAFDYEF